MITNKSTAIRLGKTKNWSIQTATNDYDYYRFSNNFNQFIDAFFSDSIFRDRGIAYSHSNINHSRKFTLIQTFLQDAKISDFIGTFPRRPLFTFRYKAGFNRFDKKRREHSSVRILNSKPGYSKFSFRKRFLFSSFSRRYTLRTPDLLKKFFHSTYSLNASRLRRTRRYSRLKISYFVGFYNYFYSKSNYRLSYYSFLSKILSKFFFSFCGSPLFVSFNHIVPRHTTSSLYLNYVCTKLYYRYILSDVVSPIVRLSLRQYRGFSINCKGRFTRAQIATQKAYRRGSLSFSYIKNHLDYAQKAVTLKYGTCSLKLWIRR